MYRGISAPMLMEAPKRAIKFTASSEWAQVFRRLNGGRVEEQHLSILTGAATGATEAIAVVPFELVKIRLQDRAQAHKYKGVIDCVLKIVRQEGPLALYQGLESTMLRHVVWNAGYFGCIYQVRSALPLPTDNRGKILNDLLAGSIGGAVGTLLNTPLDVVKTRIQNTPRIAGQVKKYNWTLPSLQKIYVEEGFRTLYSGLVPKLARFCPGGGIMLVVYTEMIGLLMQISEKAKAI